MAIGLKHLYKINFKTEIWNNFRKSTHKIGEVRVISENKNL